MNHYLEIKSLREAECSCGHWSYLVTAVDAAIKDKMLLEDVSHIKWANRNYQCFKVMVPHKGKLISYPCSGHPLYTRQEALELMERMVAKGCIADIYAESDGERFDLQCIKDGYQGQDGYGRPIYLVEPVTSEA